MVRRLIFILFFIFIFLGLSAQKGFLPNQGQWLGDFEYKFDLPDGSIFFNKDNLVYHVYDAKKKRDMHIHDNVNNDTPLSFNEKYIASHAFRIRFINKLNSSEIQVKNPSLTNYNFFFGKDRSKWRSNIKSYDTLVYKNLYKNIDLRYYRKLGKLKYEFVVYPGANPKQISFVYDSLVNIEIDKSGNLKLITSVNSIFEQKPKAYQFIETKERIVDCRFYLKENQIKYKLGKYNSEEILIIDPLIFSSYSGSTADNFGMTATYGSGGTLIAGGLAFGVGYPITLGAFDTTYNNPSIIRGRSDVVISEYNNSGSQLLYSTYVGGDQTETIHSLITNNQGELYFYGTTSSKNFPVMANAYDTTFNGGDAIYFRANGTQFINGSDIYVAKLSSDGSSMLACTYIGGSGNDGINYFNPNLNLDSIRYNYGDQYRGEIVLDSAQHPYIVSSTHSVDFPVTNQVLQDTLLGEQDAVVFSFNDSLSSLRHSTYFGGSNLDNGNSLKVDSLNNVYIAGGTTSKNLVKQSITLTGLDHNQHGGFSDGYIAKIDSNFQNLLALTHIGSADYEQAYFIELDEFNNVYVVGQTDTILPVFNVSYYDTLGTLFIHKYSNDLNTLIYATKHGNGNLSLKASPSAFLVDICQNVYVSCWGGNIITLSGQMNNMPLTSNAFQTTTNGFSFYLFVLSKNSNFLRYATYFGGNVSREHVDGGTSRFDKNGFVYQSVCAGCGSNDDFPTTSRAWSRVNGSNNCNNAVFKFKLDLTVRSSFGVDKLAGCPPFKVKFTNHSSKSNIFLWDFGNNDTTSMVENPVREFKTSGIHTIKLYVNDTTCNTFDTTHLNVEVLPSVNIDSIETPFGKITCDSAYFIIHTSNPTTNRYYVSTDKSFKNILNKNSMDSLVKISINKDSKFYVKVVNNSCEQIDSVEFKFKKLKVDYKVSCDGLNNYILNVLINNTFKDKEYLFIINNDTSKSKTGITKRFVLDKDTNLKVVILSKMGCKNTISIPIKVLKGINYNLVPKRDSIVKGLEQKIYIVTNRANLRYEWNPSKLISNFRDSSTRLLGIDTTSKLSIKVSDSLGCFFTDSLEVIRYKAICKDPQIYLPNTFTPNEDGTNDLYYVRSGILEKLEFKIYNRWGELIFATTNQQEGWNGTYQGEKCLAGAYAYYIHAYCVNGEEYEATGSITLLR